MRIAALLVALAACSASPAISPRDCTPGATSACACPGASGVQTCGADGTLGACVCADAGGVDAVSSRLDVTPFPDRLGSAPDVVDASVAPGADGAVGAADAPELPDVVDAGELDAGSTADAGQGDAECPLFVDVASDPMNCGRCGNVCPAGPNEMPRCNLGGCAGRCLPGFQQCDTNVANGCETDINNDARNCGACRNACPSNQVCRTGRCVSR